MDPRRLLTFRAVAHARSFSRAAEALSLTQPSVSHQVGLLETELGVRLFDRARGGLRLTDAGATLLAHADDVAWRLDLAQTQLADLAEDRRDRFRLGAFPTALAGFVPEAVSHLREQFADLRIRLTEVTPSTLEERFLSGQLDLAVSYQETTGPRHEPRGAERIELLEETFLIALPPEHRLARGRGPLSLRQLASEDWIVPSMEGFLTQACRDAGFEPHVVAATGGPLATRGLIRRGLGIGWVPSLLMNDYADVAVRPVRDEIPRRNVYALLPPGRRHPRAREVVDALVATARRFRGRRSIGQ